MNALLKIRQSGFEVGLRESELIVKPFSKLTPTQLAFLKSHRAEIVRQLEQEQAANDKYNRDPLDDRRFCHECQNLINRRCVVSHVRYKPVDTHPRRCADFVLC